MRLNSHSYQHENLILNPGSGNVNVFIVSLSAKYNAQEMFNNNTLFNNYNPVPD